MNTFKTLEERFSITGRVGMEPELRYTPNGRTVCNINVAGESAMTFNEDTGDAEFTPVWYRGVIFDELADLVAGRVKKGDLISIAGRLQETTSVRESDGMVFIRPEVLINKVNLKGVPIPLDDIPSSSGGSAPDLSAEVAEMAGAHAK